MLGKIHGKPLGSLGLFWGKTTASLVYHQSAEPPFSFLGISKCGTAKSINVPPSHRPTAIKIAMVLQPSPSLFEARHLHLVAVYPHSIIYTCMHALHCTTLHYITFHYIYTVYIYIHTINFVITLLVNHPPLVKHPQPVAWRRWKNDWRKAKSWKPPRSRVPQSDHGHESPLSHGDAIFLGDGFCDKVVNMWHMWQKHLESLVNFYWLHIQPHHNSFVSNIYELLTSTLHFF